MKLLAPPRNGRQRFWVRSLQTLGLTGVLAVSGLVAFIAFFAAQYFVATPHQLYHNTWEAAQELIYDPSTLEDWQSWEHKFDEQIVTDEDAIKFANQMLESIDDPYTRLHSPAEVRAIAEAAAGEFAGVGLQFEFKVGPDNKPVLDDDGAPFPDTDSDGYPVIHKVLEGGPAEKTGLINDGESLVSAGGVDLKDKAMPELIALLKGETGTRVDVVVRGASGDRTVTITRGTVDVPTVTVLEFGDVGYIGLSGFVQDDTIEEIEAAFDKLKNARALIFDLRGNGGGRIDFAIALPQMFLDEGVITVVRQRVPRDGHNRVTHRITSNAKETVFLEESTGFTKTTSRSRYANLAGDRPVVVLVDGGTASASEIFTGAVRDNGRVTVVGTKTVGKGVGQSMIPFANGTMLRVTSLRYFTPSGTWLGDGHKNATGITPDHVVEKADDFLFRKEADNQLHYAIDLLEEQLSSGN